MLGTVYVVTQYVGGEWSVDVAAVHATRESAEEHVRKVERSFGVDASLKITACPVINIIGDDTNAYLEARANQCRQPVPPDVG